MLHLIHTPPDCGTALAPQCALLSTFNIIIIIITISFSSSGGGNRSSSGPLEWLLFGHDLNFQYYDSVIFKIQD